jgi:hypothetical protein
MKPIHYTSTDLLRRIYIQISNQCSETVIVFQVALDGRQNILGYDRFLPNNFHLIH